MRPCRVVVIGAGMGGLACAIDLARAGVSVAVVEQAARPGGKMREVAAADGAGIDSGPTVFTMRWVFDDLFEAAGSSLESHLALKPLDILARHAWSADERLDLFADIDRSADAIADFAGPKEAAGYRAFCEEAQRIYGTLRSTYLTRQQTGPLGLTARIGFGNLGALFGLRPFDTMWTALGSHFADPRLRQLFGRYATYCGSSPFAAPATLMLIAHVEQAGVWAVEGGMQRLAEALETLATSLGVVFRFGETVETIDERGGRACGVTLASGERIEADAVVANADAAAFASGAFGPAVRRAAPPVSPSARSLSAVTWSLTGQAEGFPLSHHNVFFSGDYAAEFDDIFKRGHLPVDPTVYVCAQDRGDGSAESGGPERLFMLVNAPACGDRDGLGEEALAACETRVFEHLDRCGLQVTPASPPTIATPTDFNRMFPATGGALYGRGTHGPWASFQRPGAATRLPGLYLAGGGAHPGAGVPMAALSGRSAARRLIRDRASMGSFPLAAIAGGTSMR